jgi:cobalt-zinc-cadmium efflux system membrane fusion protein
MNLSILALIVSLGLGDIALPKLPTRDAHDHADHSHAEQGHDDHDHDDHGHDDHGDDEQGHDHDGETEGHADEVRLTPAAIQANNIITEKARKIALANSFSAPARIALNDDATAHVGTMLTGRVVELKARVGDKVNAGDALVVIESAELAEAQSDFILKSAEAKVTQFPVEQTRLAYERAKNLHEQNESVSLAEVQKRQGEWELARGQQQSADANLTAARNRLQIFGMSATDIDALQASGQISARHIVTSPIAGEVIEREITLGELVSPDREALLVIADLKSLWAIADVAEARVGRLMAGSTAVLRVPSISGGSISADVVYISATLHAHTRTAAVRMVVGNENGQLRPGMFARAVITPPAGDTEATVTVPAGAVLTVEGEPSVFVAVTGEPNTFARRAVRVGPVVDGMVPVLSGLNEGEPVVTRGTFILKADLGKSGAAHEH